MKIKPIISYSYRTIEILLIFSVTIGILSIGLSSHDNAEMGGLLSPCIVAIVWMWFIICYLCSFLYTLNSSYFDLQEDCFVASCP